MSAENRHGTGASPLAGFETEAPRASGMSTSRLWLWLVCAVIVLAGTYVAGQWAVADRVPGGTTVIGIDIGSQSLADAQQTLTAAIAGPATNPVPLTAGELTADLDPVAAGLGIDIEATIGGLVGFSLAPSHLWHALAGGAAVDPVITSDLAALNAEVARVSQTLAVTPVDGSVVFAEGQVVATAAVAGLAVDEAGATVRIIDNWLVVPGPIDLPVIAIAPVVTQAETDRALAEGKALVSAPVRVDIDKQVAELPISVLSSAASYSAKDAALTLSLDADTVATAVLDRTKDLETKAKNATFVFADGKPKINGGKSGAMIDRPALAQAILVAGTSPGSRTASVQLVKSEADQSRKALEKLGVKEIVSEFSTPLGASNAARLHNLVLGTAKVTGQLILPGEEWSLTETLSPITAEAGYRSAGIVNNGALTEGVGGGLSQLATTSYNMGFFAGIDDVEHRPHSYFFTRYPEGREATIFVGSIDMRVKNDTPYGILLQAYVKNGQVTVRAWSTDYYTVKTTTSPRRNVVAPTVVHSTSSNCIAQGKGSPGFAVTVTRKVYLKDELVKDESKAWRYSPQNAVVCGPKKQDKQEEKKAKASSSLAVTNRDD